MADSPELPVGEQELHALVDGELTPERAAEVWAAVSSDPERAAKAAAYRQQNALLRAELDRILDEPVPGRLLDVASGAKPGASARTVGGGAAATVPRTPAWRVFPMHAAPGWRRWALAASLLASLGVGAVAGWIGRGQVIVQAGVPVNFASEAAVIHAVYSREQRHPVEVWAAEEDHLVAWLSKRLGEPLKAPNLHEFGFSLVGGRLVANNRQPTAMFMYQNADNQRITLVARRNPDSDDTAFRYAVEDGVGVFYWIDQECGYAISGEIDKGQMLAIARSVYGQLASRTPSNGSGARTSPAPQPSTPR
jgi:anti-sigma factor RsiW